MRNCRFGGSKVNLCSLSKMTDSGWKMIRDKRTRGQERDLFEPGRQNNSFQHPYHDSRRNHLGYQDWKDIQQGPRTQLGKPHRDECQTRSLLVWAQQHLWDNINGKASGLEADKNTIQPVWCVYHWESQEIQSRKWRKQSTGERWRAIVYWWDETEETHLGSSSFSSRKLYEYCCGSFHRSSLH